MKRPVPDREQRYPEKRKRPPMQPVVIARDGLLRFQANRLVCYMLDNGGLDLNDLARVPDVPTSDMEQLMQLIGYSVSGAPIREKVRERALKRAEKVRGG